MHNKIYKVIYVYPYIVKMSIDVYACIYINYKLCIFNSLTLSAVTE